MRIAHLAPTSGIAGNMLIGACLDAGCPWEALEAILRPLDIGEWSAIRKPVTRHGVGGTYFDVEVDDPKYMPHSHASAPAPAKLWKTGESAAPQTHHPHRHYADVVAIIEAATHLSPRVKSLALDAIRRIGAVESATHGVPLEELHLHEIGAMDTIIDVVGGMAALELLGVERVYADPVHVGAGSLRSSHGVMPLPTPATLAILENFPIVTDRIGHELTTPTGAAVLMALLEASGTRESRPPVYQAHAIGYGAGSREFSDRPNLLRLTIAETVEAPIPNSLDDPQWVHETIARLTTSLDDCSPELIPHLASLFFGLGAVDVTVTPTIMKGGRPGIVLEILAPPERVHGLLERGFREGITLGFRVEHLDRIVLRRRMEETTLADGSPVSAKLGLLGEEEVFRKAEFREVAEVSERTGIPVKKLLASVHAEADLSLPEDQPDRAVAPEQPEANEYSEFDNVEFILSLLSDTEPGA